MALLKWLSRLALYGGGAAFMAGAVNAFVVTIVLFGVVDTEVGTAAARRPLLACVILIAQFFAFGPASAVVVALGRDFVQFFGFIGLALGMGASAFADTFAMWIIAQALVGVSLAAVLAAALEAVLIRFSDGGGWLTWARWIGWFLLGLVVGWLISANLAVPESRSSYAIAGWQPTLLVFAVLAVVLVLVTGFPADDGDERLHRESPLLAPDGAAAMSLSIAIGALGLAAMDFAAGGRDVVILRPLLGFLVLMVVYVLLHRSHRAHISVVGALVTAVTMSLAIGLSVAAVAWLQERAVDEGATAWTLLGLVPGLVLVLVAAVVAQYQVRGTLKRCLPVD